MVRLGKWIPLRKVKSTSGNTERYLRIAGCSQASRCFCVGRQRVETAQPPPTLVVMPCRWIRSTAWLRRSDRTAACPRLIVPQQRNPVDPLSNNHQRPGEEKKEERRKKKEENFDDLFSRDYFSISQRQVNQIDPNQLRLLHYFQRRVCCKTFSSIAPRFPKASK